MSQYVISFASELNLDAQEFVTAWNQHPAASQLAQANLPDNPTRDAATGAQLVVLLGGIAIGLATNAIYDVIKEVATPLIQQQNSVPATPKDKDEILEIRELPPHKDGTRVVLIVYKKIN